MENIAYTFLESPIGTLLIGESPRGLAMISLPEGETIRNTPSHWNHCEHLKVPAVQQLRAYFSGELTEFDLPLDLRGTDFQVSVWKALLTIPYGETISYAELARRIGNPKAVRAVGAANGKNPIPIIVPCHRVIGSNGTLTGYAGGLHVKQALLSLERQHSGRSRETLSLFS